MKFSSITAAAAVLTSVSAFPNLPPKVYRDIQQEQESGPIPAHILEERDPEKKKNAAIEFSRKETNCGLHNCNKFDAEKQHVSQTGKHAYMKPKDSDIRGPCPGLNAAANHGYLNRDGVQTVETTIFGLGEMYSMSIDLAGFLAAYAIALDGDIVGLTWSIGGPQKVSKLEKGILYPPQGISFSHNKYEGDTSIGRMDAYLNGGNAYELNLTHFKDAYHPGQKYYKGRYTLDTFRAHTVPTHQEFSVKHNPFYFAPLFSTTLVAPAAHNFVINFMSNHSAEEPQGYLDGEMFKTFFGLSGDFDNKKHDGGLKLHNGEERLPKNWYKRPRDRAYQATDVFKDLLVAWAAYPDTFRFGGNTNGVNTYQGVDVATLTGGTFTPENLFEGNNFACLVFLTQQQAVPDQLKGFLTDVSPATKLIEKFSKPIYSKLACPKLNKYDASVFNDYPGRHYSPCAPGGLLPGQKCPGKGN